MKEGQDNSSSITSIPTSLDVNGTECAVHTWNISSDANGNNNASHKRTRGLVILYHGFLAHSKYPTVRYIAEALSSANFSVIGVDLPGHGLSKGLRGYVPSSDAMVDFAVSVVEFGRRVVNDDTMPIFLAGSSLGGAMAIAASQKLSDQMTIEIAGVALLAPMLALNVGSIERGLLQGLSYVCPTLNVIPSSATSSEKQYRDPQRRKECDEDPLCVSGGKLRIASACSCVSLAHSVRSTLSEVSTPFICMLAKNDMVVNNIGGKELMEQSKSSDKTLKEYDALHGLFCEPKPLIDEIEADLLDWINQRVK